MNIISVSLQIINNEMIDNNGLNISSSINNEIIP